MISLERGSRKGFKKEVQERGSRKQIKSMKEIIMRLKKKGNKCITVGFKKADKNGMRVKRIIFDKSGDGFKKNDKTV